MTDLFEFLEKPELLSRKISVERTQKSKYLFYLVMRSLRKKFKLKPQFFVYEKTKKVSATVKGIIEEHSIFEEKRFIILEGFGQSFVDTLSPPEGTYVLAETDGGDLKAELYSYKQRRGILKALINLLSLDYSLRALLKIDWSSLESYEEFEPILLRAKLMSLTEEEIAKSLESQELGNLLTLMKRGEMKPILNMIDWFGVTWVYNRLIKHVTDVIHYRNLRNLGYDEDRASRELNAGYRRKKELEECMKMLTGQDLKLLVERIIELDPEVFYKGRIGLEQLILNSPINVKK